MDAGIEAGQVMGATGLQKDGIAVIAQAGHESGGFLLQHRLTAGDFHEGRPGITLCLLFDLTPYFLKRHLITAIERIGRVAPRTAKITTGKPHENTRQTGKGAFTLQAEINFADDQGAGHAGIIAQIHDAGQTCRCGGTNYNARVKLSVKSDYAARAVLELAARPGEGRAHKADDLAEVVGTSANYLVQILIELKGAGLVKSVRGKQGGYRLAMAPAEITLGSVMRAVDGEVFDPPALGDGTCSAVLRAAWDNLRGEVNAAADAVTFEELLEARGREQEMYYI